MELHESNPVSRYPWAVLGDFNQILRISHHSNHLSALVDTSGIEEINITLQEAELFEAQAKGVPYTWRNNQDDNPISTKIDHALINQQWSDYFLDPSQSAHAPCLFRLPSFNRRVTKPFKYFHHVADHPQFTELVSEGWCFN